MREISQGIDYLPIKIEHFNNIDYAEDNLCRIIINLAMDNNVQIK